MEKCPEILLCDDHRSAKFNAATRRLRRAGWGSRRSGDITIFGIVGFVDLCADSIANDQCKARTEVL